MEGFGCAHHRVRCARNSQLSSRMSYYLSRSDSLFCRVARLGSVCYAGSRSEASHVWRRRESLLLLLERLRRISRSPPFFNRNLALVASADFGRLDHIQHSIDRFHPAFFFFFFAENLSSFNPTTREQAVVSRHGPFKTACQKGNPFEGREVGRFGHGSKCFILN